MKTGKDIRTFDENKGYGTVCGNNDFRGVLIILDEEPAKCATIQEN